MKIIRIVTLLISLTSILSCGPGVPTQDSAIQNKSEAATIGDGNINTVTPATNVSAAGLNPAHGQPGHRCDIGVGQPLNGNPATPSTAGINAVTTAITPTPKPATSSAPIINPNTQSVSNPSTITPSNTPTGTGLNPKHGQPGHRCDILVGQPLNSKPAQPATTPTTNPVQTNNATATPAPAATSTTVAPGMNPKHGQPGHRCDILVGQPLNSKPANTATETAPVTPWKFPIK